MDNQPLQTESDSSTPTLEHSQALEFNNPQKNGLLVATSWLTILTVVAGIAGLVSYSQFFMPRSMETSAAELLGVNMTAKMLMGFPQSENDALQQAEQFATGPLEQRYGHAILVNEISGPTEALACLDKIDQAVENEVAARNEASEEDSFPTESQEKIREILGSLFENYSSGRFDSSHVTEDERELLEEKMGWVAQIALYPKDSPDKPQRAQLERVGQRVFWILVLAMLAGICAIFAAFAAVFLFLIMIVTRSYKVHFEERKPYSFVYIETFAIWVLVFFGAQILSGVIVEMVNEPTLGLALGPVSFFGSLVALAWPMIRGIPLRIMLTDIGWELRNPFVEVFVGGFSYLALIVPMIFGVTISVLLGLGLSLLVSTGEFESAGPVGHPIAGEIAKGGPAIWLAVFVSACVAAPIVEETMFRGVLYRYLRDATQNANHARWFSVAVSSVFGSLIFALIHPQGIVGVPVLMTLAIGFSLVREWRNSLIGPMVMHAINNSLVTCLLILIVMQ